ncbi:MAG: hypothetical protein FWE23_08935 [Chitinivibrionia bacterium]|nr:hypothetical protein [Chitinivibrionia bacterium]
MSDTSDRIQPISLREKIGTAAGIAGTMAKEGLRAHANELMNSAMNLPSNMTSGLNEVIRTAARDVQSVMPNTVASDIAQNIEFMDNPTNDVLLPALAAKSGVAPLKFAKQGLSQAKNLVRGKWGKVSGDMAKNILENARTQINPAGIASNIAAAKVAHERADDDGKIRVENPFMPEMDIIIPNISAGQSVGQNIRRNEAEARATDVAFSDMRQHLRKIISDPKNINPNDLRDLDQQMGDLEKNFREWQKGNSLRDLVLGAAQSASFAPNPIIPVSQAVGRSVSEVFNELGSDSPLATGILGLDPEKPKFSDVDRISGKVSSLAQWRHRLESILGMSPTTKETEVERVKRVAGDIEKFIRGNDQLAFADVINRGINDIRTGARQGMTEEDIENNISEPHRNIIDNAPFSEAERHRLIGEFTDPVGRFNQEQQNIKNQTLDRFAKSEPNTQWQDFNFDDYDSQWGDFDFDD